MGDNFLATLQQMVDEATLLRLEAPLPAPDATTGAVLDCLLDVRRRLDRLEEILGVAIQYRGTAGARHTAVRITADEAWDEVAVRQRTRGLRDEFSSAKERTAAVNLLVLDLRRAENEAKSYLDRADVVVEFLRLRHRGLADLRQDLISIIRTRQWETSLDR